MKQKLDQGIFYTHEPKIPSLDIYCEDDGRVFIKIGKKRGTRYKEIGKLTVFYNCYKYQRRIHDGNPLIELDMAFRK